MIYKLLLTTNETLKASRPGRRRTPPLRSVEQRATEAARGRLALLHLLAGADDLVDEQQLRGDDGGRVEHLVLDAVVVPDARDRRVHRLAVVHVEAQRGLAVGVRLLQLDDRVLRVVARVGRERLRDDEQ